MPDYQKGKIYKIINYENSDIYIGSTIETLSCRMAKHRADFKRYVEGNSNYITSFKVLEMPSATIVLIENFPCNSKEELLSREKFYILSSNCVNKVNPIRTEEELLNYQNEYKTLNRGKILEYKINYRETNKQKILESAATYRKNNADKIKTSKKKHYDNNKEKIAAQKKKYNELNKEKLKAYRKQYYQSRKHNKNLSDYEMWNKNIKLVNSEIILNNHIVNWRFIMKSMLKDFFGKRIIKLYNNANNIIIKSRIQS